MLPFKNGAYYEFLVKYKVLKIDSSLHTHNELTATTTINIILAEIYYIVIILMTVDPHKTWHIENYNYTARVSTRGDAECGQLN